MTKYKWHQHKNDWRLATVTTMMRSVLPAAAPSKKSTISMTGKRGSTKKQLLICWYRNNNRTLVWFLLLTCFLCFRLWHPLVDYYCPYSPEDLRCAVAHGRRNAYEICFVTAVYADKVGETDLPADVRRMAQENPSFQFYLYTNLPQLEAPGWTKVTPKHHHHYKRYITQSRWSKFMGWQDEYINKCQFVFYLDGFFAPKNVPHLFRSKAREILFSEVQFGQYRHLNGGTALIELERIVEDRKDIPINIQTTLEWFKAQPDFFDNCTLYANTFIGTFSYEYSCVSSI